jgi:type IV pilus assembly protein PilV
MLVALLIITVGLLGIAGLQAYSLKNNTSAYHRSQANTLIYDIFDAMRANRTAALDGMYAVSSLSATLPSATGDSRADADLTSWFWRLSNTLPIGRGMIDCDGNPLTCTVTVQWDDTRGQGAGATQQMTVSGLIGAVSIPAVRARGPVA